MLSWTTGDVLQCGPSCFPGCFLRLPLQSPGQPQIITVNTTSIPSPGAQQSIDYSCLLCPIMQTFSAQNKAPSYHHTDHGTVPLTWNQMSQFPMGESTQPPSLEYVEEALKQGYSRLVSAVTTWPIPTSQRAPKIPWFCKLLLQVHTELQYYDCSTHFAVKRQA